MNSRALGRDEIIIPSLGEWFSKLVHRMNPWKNITPSSDVVDSEQPTYRTHAQPRRPNSHHMTVNYAEERERINITASNREHAPFPNNVSIPDYWTPPQVLTREQNGPHTQSFNPEADYKIARSQFINKQASDLVLAVEDMTSIRNKHLSMHLHTKFVKILGEEK